MVARTARTIVRGAGGIAALLAVTLALAACGGAVQEADEARVPASPTTSSSPPSAPVDPFGPAAPDEIGDDGDPVLAWIPLGPSSPSDPPEQNWYPHLRDRDCATLRSLIDGEQALPVWVAAATICDAMTSGDEALWLRGKAEVAALGPPPTDSVSCFNAAVQTALIRAIAFHEEHPGLRQVQTTPAGGTACPLVLTGLRPEDPSGGRPECGSDWFLLVGRLLASTAVAVDGEAPEVTIGHLDRLYFRMPDGEPGQVSTVEARSPDGRVLGTLTYTHPSPEEECGSPDEVEETTAPPSGGPTPTPSVGEEPVAP